MWWLIIGSVSGFLAGLAFSSRAIMAAFVSGSRRAFKEAARHVGDAASFELSDTEGRVGQRLERARIAYDLADDLRQMEDVYLQKSRNS